MTKEQIQALSAEEKNHGVKLFWRPRPGQHSSQSAQGAAGGAPASPPPELAAGTSSLIGGQAWSTAHTREEANSHFLQIRLKHRPRKLDFPIKLGCENGTPIPVKGCYMFELALLGAWLKMCSTLCWGQRRMSSPASISLKIKVFCSRPFLKRFIFCNLNGQFGLL